MLAFALALSLVTGVAFGLIPVIRFGTPNIAALKEGGRSSSDGPARHRARNALVVAEIALALVLLIVSGLMIRTFLVLRDVAPGFVRPEEVQTFRVAIPEALFEEPARVARAHEEIAQRLARVSGVTSVGVSSSIHDGRPGQQRSDLRGNGAPPGRTDAAAPSFQVDRTCLLRHDGKPCARGARDQLGRHPPGTARG